MGSLKKNDFMITYLETYPIIILGITAILGFFTGFIVGVKYSEKRDGYNIPNGTLLAWFIASLWIGFHVYSMLVSGIKVATIFDVIGAMCVGSVIGFDVASLLAKFIKK